MAGRRERTKSMVPSARRGRRFDLDVLIETRQAEPLAPRPPWAACSNVTPTSTT